jgi:HEAT repeat protein
MIRFACAAFSLCCLLGVGLLAGCHQGDAASAQKVFEAPPPPPPVPPVRAMAIDPALQDQARDQIVQALQSSDAVIRAHALEVVKNVNLPGAAPMLAAALNDRSPLVRKAAALAAGEMQARVPEEPLLAMLQANDRADRLAAVFALHRLGNTAYSHRFEATAVDTDPHIRGDTALMLGMLGEKSAVPILQHMLKDDHDPDVRLQAAGALWRLGDEHGLDELVAATLSRYPDDQMVAVLALAQPHDTRVLGHIEAQLTADYPEVALVAARAAGMLGSDRGYGVAMEGSSSRDPRRRLLAAMAFGDIGRADAQPILKKLLNDADPDVRLAAAGALLEIGNANKA